MILKFIRLELIIFKNSIEKQHHNCKVLFLPEYIQYGITPAKRWVLRAEVALQNM
jgi:hypothetical protein